MNADVFSSLLERKSCSHLGNSDKTLAPTSPLVSTKPIDSMELLGELHYLVLRSSDCLVDHQLKNTTFKTRLLYLAPFDCTIRLGRYSFAHPIQIKWLDA